MEKFLELMKQNIDEMIKSFEEMILYYEEKKQALITQKSECLSSVDDKIKANIAHIEELNKRRNKILEEYEKDTMNLSEIINYALKEESPLKAEFEAQKVKISEVAKQLSLLESMNVELIKHGLTMSDKLLNIIISAAVPQTDNYDQHGKNVDNTSISISSIVENA